MQRLRTFGFPYLNPDKSAVSTVALSPEAMTLSTSEGSGSVPVGATSASAEQIDKIVVCELLFFVNNNFDKHPPETVKSVICDFYREDEVLAAKSTLIHALPHDIKGTATDKYVTRRIGLHKTKNSVDDILNLLDVIDSNGFRDKLPTFCAANMSRIPMLPDEMTDLSSIRFELNMLRKQVEILSSNLKPHTAAWKANVNHGECEQNVANMEEYPPLATKKQEELTSGQSVQPAVVQSVLQSSVCTAVENTNDDGSWQQQKKKHHPKKKLVIGCSEDHVSFTGVARRSVVCVSRLQS